MVARAPLSSSTGGLAVASDMMISVYFCLSMISAPTLHVCREEKPAPTLR
jgi:hypothetical protein